MVFGRNIIWGKQNAGNNKGTELEADPLILGMIAHVRFIGNRCLPVPHLHTDDQSNTVFQLMLKCIKNSPHNLLTPATIGKGFVCFFITEFRNHTNMGINPLIGTSFNEYHKDKERYSAAHQTRRTSHGGGDRAMGRVSLFALKSLQTFTLARKNAPFVFTSPPQQSQSSDHGAPC